MQKNHDIVEFKGTVKHETVAAVLAVIDGKEVWLPKSKVEITPVSGLSNKFEFQMPEWLAVEKELV